MRWGPHSVERFASFGNKQLPRYNTKWRDGKVEAFDSVHLLDWGWHETNSCNPPWSLLDDLTAKLRQSSAGATVIALNWPRYPWFAHLSEMASEMVEISLPRTSSLCNGERGKGG